MKDKKSEFGKMMEGSRRKGFKEAGMMDAYWKESRPHKVKKKDRRRDRRAAKKALKDYEGG